MPSKSSNESTSDVQDVEVIEPELFHDERGWFYEAFNLTRFQALVGADVRFVQDNQSRSVRGVLRGLHYQVDPMAQGKLVRVTRGAIFDVAVDIRRSSPRFGHWSALELSEQNFKQVWIPPGFAHGFLALTDHAEVLYKTTEYHSLEHERVLRWDDPELGVEWPLLDEPILSRRDATAPGLSDVDVFD